MVRRLLVAVLALAVSGCDLVSTGLMSRSDKVNTAFPLPEEIVTAQNSLFNALGDDKSAARLKTQYAQVLEVRALTCSNAAEIGRFTTVADVRKRITDTSCFRDQNLAVAEWVGLQRFLLAMRRPALVPLAGLPGRVVIPAQAEGPAGVSMARSANVAVITTSRGAYTTVALPSGKVIANFPAIDRASVLPTLPLSPNGRVLPVRAGGEGMKMVDTETGTVLWSTSKYNSLLAWLPEVDATLLGARGTSAGVLLDHRTGKADPYPIPVGRPTWSTSTAGGISRLLVGDSHNALLVEHTRNAEETLAVDVVKQWRLTGQGVTSMAPMVMSGGRKLVYVSMRDLAWLDMDTEKQGVWNTSHINGRGFAKINDTTLYTDAEASGAARGGWLFDVEKETLAPVPRSSEDEGLLMSTAPREGYARRGFQAMVIGSAMSAEGEPAPLEKLITERQLEQQLAKLNAPQYGMSPAEQAAAAAVAAAAAAGGYPRISRASIAVGPSTHLPGVSPDAHVSVIGVYESAKKPKTGGANRAGPVRVTIPYSRVPLVLVLSSYESIQWRIHNQGRPIAAVLLSGYHPSTVTGVEGKTVVIGSHHAYEVTSAGYAQLKAQIARYVPNPVRLFQGTYAGSEFTVPVN